MNPLKCHWKPEVLENTLSSHITTPPLGKPDPYMRRLEGFMRPRVFQKAQVGPTCMYYAARRLSPHFGKASEFSFYRLNEKILSLFKKALSQLSNLNLIQGDEDSKSFFASGYIANYGCHIHGPLLFMNVLFQMSFYQRTSFCSLPVSQSYFTSISSQFHTVHKAQRVLASYSLRLMLLRMHLIPHYWTPDRGDLILVEALRHHFYFFCIGHFGRHTFSEIHPVDSHPSLGLIYSGDLKPLYENKTFLNLHAIVVIGLKITQVNHGELYFIDPVDPSGPGLLQRVYKIAFKEFLTRVRSSFGYAPRTGEQGEYIWVGNPGLFLP